METNRATHKTEVENLRRGQTVVLIDANGFRNCRTVSELSDFTEAKVTLWTTTGACHRLDRGTMIEFVPTAEQFADEAWKQILADMADETSFLGNADRFTIRSFSDLHDHVDANEYLFDADEAGGLEFANRVADLLDARLAAGEHLLIEVDCSGTKYRGRPTTGRIVGNRWGETCVEIETVEMVNFRPVHTISGSGCVSPVWQACEPRIVLGVVRGLSLKAIRP